MRAIPAFVEIFWLLLSSQFSLFCRTLTVKISLTWWSRYCTIWFHCLPFTTKDSNLWAYKPLLYLLTLQTTSVHNDLYILEPWVLELLILQSYFMQAQPASTPSSTTTPAAAPAAAPAPAQAPAPALAPSLAPAPAPVVSQWVLPRTCSLFLNLFFLTVCLKLFLHNGFKFWFIHCNFSVVKYEVYCYFISRSLISYYVFGPNYNVHCWFIHCNFFV